MKAKKLGIILTLAVAILLAACNPAVKPTETLAPTEAQTTVAETTVAATTAAETRVATTEEAATTAEATEAAENEKIITATDMKGRTVTVQSPVQRVVAVTPADCEILFALGAGDLLVGRGSFADYPAEVLDVQEVTSGAEFNTEQVLSLEPDLVLIATMAQDQEQVNVLEEAGIAVAVSDAQDLAGVYEAITLIGRLVDREEAAEALIGDMQDRFAAIEEKVSAEEKTAGSIYFEVSPLEWGLWTAGHNTFMDELATLVGAENAFSDIDGWAEISEEQVIERDPDFIVTVTMYFGEGPTPVEEIMSRKGWEAMQAIKEGRVLNADSDEITRPGPRLADAAETLCDFVYASAETP